MLSGIPFLSLPLILWNQRFPKFEDQGKENREERGSRTRMELGVEQVDPKRMCVG